MALVLCTGSHPLLVETRKLILEEAGHTVIGVTNEPDLASAGEKHHFDVAVIGQTTSPELKRTLFSLIRKQCPSAKVLELYQPHEGKTLEGADSWLQVPADVPQELVERVNQLASKEKQRRSA